MHTMDRAVVADADRSDDQVIVLRRVSWAQYEGLLRARGENPRPLMAYLDGELELVTTSRHHELVKVLLRRLVETYTLELEIPLNGFGEATLKRKARRAGCEPDEWYCIGEEKRAPDLAIEIVHTSGVDKLEIYRRLGAREVWFWIAGRIHVYVLGEAGYRVRSRSAALPGFDVRAVERILASTPAAQQSRAVRRFQLSLRRRS